MEKGWVVEVDRWFCAALIVESNRSAQKACREFDSPLLRASVAHAFATVRTLKLAVEVAALAASYIRCIFGLGWAVNDFGAQTLAETAVWIASKVNDDFPISVCRIRAARVGERPKVSVYKNLEMQILEDLEFRLMFVTAVDFMRFFVGAGPRSSRKLRRALYLFMEHGSVSMPESQQKVPEFAAACVLAACKRTRTRIGPWITHFRFMWPGIHRDSVRAIAAVLLESAPKTDNDGEDFFVI